jgi:hypothetical protein
LAKGSEANFFTFKFSITNVYVKGRRIDIDIDIDIYV